MHFKRHEAPARFTETDERRQAAFWLRDDNDHVISFRDKEAADHFRRMVEASEAYCRASPAFQPATLDARLCEFDNNGYVIQLTLSRPGACKSGIILLSGK